MNYDFSERKTLGNTVAHELSNKNVSLVLFGRARCSFYRSSKGRLEKTETKCFTNISSFMPLWVRNCRVQRFLLITNINPLLEIQYDMWKLNYMKQQQEIVLQTVPSCLQTGVKTSIFLFLLKIHLGRLNFKSTVSDWHA